MAFASGVPLGRGSSFETPAVAMVDESVIVNTAVAAAILVSAVVIVFFIKVFSF
jgi:hypothetical protein